MSGVLLLHLFRPSLRSARSNHQYSSKLLEFKAVVWALCERFSHYLIGSVCKVITDNSALSYIYSTKKLSAVEQRGMNKLAPYKLTFKFRPGKENSRADALSRLRYVDGIKCKEDDRVGLAAIEVDTDDVGMRLFDDIDKDELSIRQREDPVLGVIIDRVKSGIGNKLGNVLIDGVLMEKKIPGIDGHRVMVPKSLVGTLMKGCMITTGTRELIELLHVLI